MTDDVIKGPADRGFWYGVNMEEELFATAEGLVHPITNWYGAFGDECAKDEAVMAVAGRGFRWYAVHLGEFGIGPLADKYKDLPTDNKEERDAALKAMFRTYQLSLLPAASNDTGEHQ